MTFCTWVSYAKLATVGLFEAKSLFVGAKWSSSPDAREALVRELAEIRSCNTSTLAYKLAQHKHKHCGNRWDNIAANIVSICAFVAGISPQDSPVSVNRWCQRSQAQLACHSYTQNNSFIWDPEGMSNSGLYCIVTLTLTPLQYDHAHASSQLQTICSTSTVQFIPVNVPMGTSQPSSCGTVYASWRCSISARTKITCSQNLCPCSTLILRHVPRINTVLPWQWMSWKSPKHACTHQTPQCGWSCKYDNTVSSTRYEKFTWISTQANLHEIMSPVIVRMEVCALQFHREVLANAPVPRQSD